MAEWFERWFGEEYLALYPHRDEREAEVAVRLIEREVGDARVRRVLDLACGAGRHARLLSERWSTVGLDLSPVLLKVARETDPNSDYVRADMRALPFRRDSFDLVTNLFTSFGYFDTDDEHLTVLREVRSVLAPGGLFVLDFLNAPHVRAALVPFDVSAIGNVTVEQRRSLTDDGRFVVKRISAREDGRSYVERVRLFEPDELRAMLVTAGFEVASVFGDYEGGALTAESPRAMFFARRPGESR